MNSLLIQQLLEISTEAFSGFCRNFLVHLGFTNIKIKTSVQLLEASATINLGILSQEFAILIVQKEDVVKVKEILKFRNNMPKHTDKGLLISLGSFDKETKRESRAKGKVPIDLINGTALIDRLAKMDNAIEIGNPIEMKINPNWYNGEFLAEKNRQIIR